MSPRVSVVMAVRNGAPFIEEAIESTLQQTFRDWELIVIDDASNDGTAEIVNSFDDPRIRLARNPKNLGPYPTANLGIEMAGAPLIARLDADDVSFPYRIERQVAEFDRDDQLVLVSGEFVKVNADGRVAGIGDVSRRSGHPRAVPFHLLFYNHLGAHSQIMFRRRVAREVGGYPTENRYSQDYALWVRMADRGKICVLPLPLIKYRVHEENISSAHGADQELHSYRISQAYISHVTQHEVSIEDVSTLRSFYATGPFPPMDRLSFVDGIMKNCLRDFARSDARPFPLGAVSEIRERISHRLFLWAVAFFKRKQFWGSMRALYMSFRWSPSRALSDVSTRANRTVSKLLRRMRLGRLLGPEASDSPPYRGQ